MRLEEARQRLKHWRRWGPYLSERQWGTVREDYSESGDAWSYFPFEHSHLRAYRWGEDGLCGISDNHQRLCFALALWNGRDPILKERLFGLSGPAGNHGEDVKECYYYLDSTPTHSYLKCLYKYPQAEFPYRLLREENVRRTRLMPEFELPETGVFNEGRYFDVFVEYAKSSPHDILIRITAHNRGLDPTPLHVLPTLWCRNTWAWGRGYSRKPSLKALGQDCVEAQLPRLGRYRLWLENPLRLLFTENETNTEVLYGQPSHANHCKNAFHDFVVLAKDAAVNPSLTGTKACGYYRFTVPPFAAVSIRLRLEAELGDAGPFTGFEEVFSHRIEEADEFYSAVIDPCRSEAARAVARQAFAGLLWSKQHYHYVVDEWLTGDPAYAPPPASRRAGRNRGWVHLYNDDVISMPDKWEYPWYAAWDLAFHVIPFALIDPEFAKSQLALFLREWYMHPNGQIPAYEWRFCDVNPPVHAWACWRVFQIDRRLSGKADHGFLERVFHKLLMNFTWWVNRKDSAGHNVFEGGFLGLDNIGVFDRSAPLPTGGVTEQSDATAWMGLYCLNMLKMAMELATVNSTYEDIASKFFEHFVYIAYAMNQLGGGGLWDELDGFYYDSLCLPGSKEAFLLRIRSFVGLMPLFAVETVDMDAMLRLRGFLKRTLWFVENRWDLVSGMASTTAPGIEDRRLFSVVPPDRLLRVLKVMLDENEFLSPYGLRSMSRFHQHHPFILNVQGSEYRVDYEAAESATSMFGGNSNWRGPVWLPLNFLMIESLQKYDYYYGEKLKVECPTGSGRRMTLGEVAADLSRRLVRLFLVDAKGHRPCFGDSDLLQHDPHFRDYLLFHEYFHADTGKGLGASHQTGWTALVAKLILQSGT
jgi:hypothetical protein